MKIDNPVLRQIWEDRYSKNNEDIKGNLHRVAKHCSTNKEEENAFYDIMYKGLFFPAGRTMSNAGIGRDLTLNNCFTSPLIKDDLVDIFQKVLLGAKTHQRGGGIGYNFSQLRPKGSPTSNDAIASGAISFMDVFNAQTDTILQGSRRGANMGLMSIYSMDIEDFVNAKAYDVNKLNHFNVTVMIDDDFMNAKNSNEDIWLHYPVYDDSGFILKDEAKWKYKKQISAKYLWDLIIQRAYENGEPGIAYCDTMNKDNNLWYIENIIATNPCFEYLSGTVYGKNPITRQELNSDEYGGACNLGSLMLHNFVSNPFTIRATVDYNKLKETIHTAVNFLDNIIDINKFPDVIYENYQNAFRTIGLGITGFADMLAMLGLKYGSKESQLFTFDLMNFITLNAYRASIELAKEKGEFPFIDREKFIKSGFLQKHAARYEDWEHIVEDIKKYGIRNSKMISVAPTGTMSLTFGNNCSSGLEPIFSLEYDRKVKIGGQSDDDIQIVKMQDYGYKLWQETAKDNVVGKDVFVTALNLSVQEHLDMLRQIAYHVDMSSSKTINLPTEYSFEDTKKVYDYCWEAGIKGCTIFRPNEIRQGILIDSSTVSKEVEVKSSPKLERGFILNVNDDVIGKKRKLISGCGSLHCVALFDPDNGDLLETYLSKGSTGGCQNFMVGLSRMISLAARGGIDIYAIIDQLNSTGVCPSYAVRTATKKDTSKGSCCPVAIGKALLDMYKEVLDELGIEENEIETPVKQSAKLEVKHEAQNGSNTLCPECNEVLVNEGGCIQCKSCGWSLCN